MAPRIFRTRLCSKCKNETDRAALLKLNLSRRIEPWSLRTDVELCARCLDVELRAGQRIVRGHLPWFIALPIGVFIVGPLFIRLFQVPAESWIQVATFVGLIVMTLARAVPMPGASVLSEVSAENRLDLDRAIELAKTANAGTTNDTEYFQLKSLCTGPREIEALLMIAQFGGGPTGIEPKTVLATSSPAGSSSDNEGLALTHDEESAGLASDSSDDESAPSVTPCPACGGRGRLERQMDRPGFLGRFLSATVIIEKCPACNGTGAADVS
jgi:hypothetical protein